MKTSTADKQCDICLNLVCLVLMRHSSNEVIDLPCHYFDYSHLTGMSVKFNKGVYKLNRDFYKLNRDVFKFNRDVHKLKLHSFSFIHLA